MYDVERFGIINTGNPKHADVFLVTGSVNEQNISVIKQIYDQMPRPKVVVAVGICAISGGVFKECYNIMGGVDTVIPVDVYVPGCAARPEAIIDGVVKGLAALEEKRKRLPEEIAAEKAAEREEKAAGAEALAEAAKEQAGGADGPATEVGAAADEDAEGSEKASAEPDARIEPDEGAEAEGKGGQNG
jgi:ech hydrogenase subunit C